MLSVENLIVEGRYVFWHQITPDFIKDVKSRIIRFMNKEGLALEGSAGIFFEDNFLSMTFLKNLFPEKVPTKLQIKKSLGFNCNQELSDHIYSSSLKSTVISAPFKIRFVISVGKMKEKECMLITVRSEPAILFQIRQLRTKPYVTDFEYSDIVEHNKQFIKEIMLGVGASEIRSPEALSKIIETQITEELKKTGFDKVADILNKGRLKVQKGDTEDGLTDLRASLEIFISDLVSKIGGEPANQDKIKENLNKLKENGYLDDFSFNLLLETIYNRIYHYLSNVPIHKREKASKLDAEFMFSLAEDCMKVLIEKVVYRGS